MRLAFYSLSINAAPWSVIGAWNAQNQIGLTFSFKCLKLIQMNSVNTWPWKPKLFIMVLRLTRSQVCVCVNVKLTYCSLSHPPPNVSWIFHKEKCAKSLVWKLHLSSVCLKIPYYYCRSVSDFTSEGHKPQCVSQTRLRSIMSSW